ncbi:IPTL-CTERM sorting domain-containing protein [Elongatibacter sediminis]|uniref:IPTL-CTERM sorting domain-containing protein n=1 Tax=Elongatibacter sediminis TaxID=3119006 RepID=A0AAW9RAQ7_9GAMM
MTRNVSGILSTVLAAPLLLAATAAQAQGILYLATDEGSDELYTVNTSTAEVTQIGVSGSHSGDVEGLAPGPDGSVLLFGVDNEDTLTEINRNGSGDSSVGSLGENCDRGLAYNTTTGKLYGSDGGDFCEINPTNGSATLLPSPPFVSSNDLEGLAADPVNNYVYGVNEDENLIRFDVAGNSWSTIGATGIPDADDIGMAYDPGTQTIYVIDEDGILYSVNPANGATSVIGDTGLDVGQNLDAGLAFVPGASASTRATFEVTKDFSDDNPGEVDVTISCNTGLPLEQTKAISEEEGVVFVVTDFDGGELDCEITETVPAGYEVEYDNGDTVTDVSCAHEDVADGSDFTCAITNTPAPVDIVIEKEWVFEGSTGPEGVDTDYWLTLWCDAEIVNGVDTGDFVEAPAVPGPKGPGGCGLVQLTQESGQFIGNYHNWCQSFYGDSSAVFNAQVIPEYPDSHCYVTESVFDGAVEVDNGCDDLTVSAGQGASCTITNSVFYEGIPTLSQYGMALLALLMLGVGFVGLRRFV